MKVPFGLAFLTRTCFIALLGGILATTVSAQPDRLAEASSLERIKLFINYTPLQKEVDIDLPSEEELRHCKLERAENPAGYIVRDNTGRILRKFLDTSGNKKLDHLSYYKNGVEVYREIDNTGNGKPQEFRWLGSGGTRWGIDTNGDAKIDQWKQIAVEELVKEVFEAVKSKDARRFEALLITAEEIQSLKLGETLGKELDARWQKAKKEFSAFCSSQRNIDEKSQFANATNGIPSLVAKDTYGNSTDLLFYDHASAVYQNSDKDYGNLSIGTIVSIGNGQWRLVELPEVAAPGVAISNGGLFYSQVSSPISVAASDQGINKTLIEIHNQLDAIESKIKNASKPAEIAKLEENKAGLLEKLVYESDAGEQQKNTLMYAVDSIVNAYQEDHFPDGLKFLDGLAQRIKTRKIEGVDYIKWRSTTGRFNYVNRNGSNEERDKANERWLAELMEFQKEFPTSEYTAEALCYLGVNFDNEGKEKEALEWYSQAAKKFPDSNYGKRAKGAIARLDGVEKKLTFSGQDLKGNKFNLQDAKWRDKVVVLHYWESDFAEGLDEIQRLVEKYKEDVVFIGCNIDQTTETFEAYLKKHPEYATWTQLHAPGSIEASPLALQLGVPSLPLVIIVNKKGELAEPMVIFADLDRQIERQRRK